MNFFFKTNLHMLRHKIEQRGKIEHLVSKVKFISIRFTIPNCYSVQLQYERSP